MDQGYQEPHEAEARMKQKLTGRCTQRTTGQEAEILTIYDRRPSAKKPQAVVIYAHQPVLLVFETSRIRNFTSKILIQDDEMSPLLGITPPTDIVAKQRPDGEFPISKGFNLLSVSRNGKGNATPWEVTQRSGEGRGGSENIKKMLFDLRSKSKIDREKFEFI